MCKLTEFKDKRRRTEYAVFCGSYNMWKKADNICLFMVENTQSSVISDTFNENVNSFIGELEGLKRYNHNHLPHQPRNKCAEMIIPRLKNIIKLSNAMNYIALRHEVCELHFITTKMCKRFSKLY